MKTIKLQMERFDLTVKFSATIQEYSPIGFEPCTAREVYEKEEYEFYIKGMNKKVSTNYLFFEEMINYVTEGNIHYNEGVVKANGGKSVKGQYICQIGGCMIRVNEDEKNEILKAVAELKEEEYKEQNLYEAKKEQVIEEAEKEIANEEEYIAKCEDHLKKDEKLMTDSEIKEYVIKWNNLYNEGHQEPLPFEILSKEKYERCIYTLELLNTQLKEYKIGNIF